MTRFRGWGAALALAVGAGTPATQAADGKPAVARGSEPKDKKAAPLAPAADRTPGAGAAVDPLAVAPPKPASRAELREVKP